MVDPYRCTGCGACIHACPVGVLDLIPREQSWYVACSSHREPGSREQDCSAACIGCGECERHSGRSEFSLKDSLARENPESIAGRWQDIAETCPTRAILLSGSEKKRPSSFPAKGR
jgi:electron transport complex protein RnfB